MINLLKRLKSLNATVKSCSNLKCTKQNPQPINSFYKCKTATDYLQSICKSCQNEMALNSARPWRIYKKKKCSDCGFKGHPCQLDVDHVDGNKLNNKPNNLKTLCANCHRLKTYTNRDSIKSKYKDIKDAI